jgi:hypothetical protein
MLLVLGIEGYSQVVDTGLYAIHIFSDPYYPSADGSCFSNSFITTELHNPHYSWTRPIIYLGHQAYINLEEYIGYVNIDASVNLFIHAETFIISVTQPPNCDIISADSIYNISLPFDAIDRYYNFSFPIASNNIITYDGSTRVYVYPKEIRAFSLHPNNDTLVNSDFPTDDRKIGRAHV